MARVAEAFGMRVLVSVLRSPRWYNAVRHETAALEDDSFVTRHYHGRLDHGTHRYRHAIESSHTAVTAVKKAEDGVGIIVRLVEMSCRGKAGKVCVLDASRKVVLETTVRPNEKQAFHSLFSPNH